MAAVSSAMGLGTTVQRAVASSSASSFSNPLPSSSSSAAVSSIAFRRSNARFVAAAAPSSRASSSTAQLRSDFFWPNLIATKRGSSNRTGATRGARASKASAARAMASDPAELKAAREDVRALLREKHCHPILIRLGWHDAGTYDKNVAEFPRRGGANGSLRFSIELDHAANAGLITALKLLEPVKAKYPHITYADLFQLASATAIEEAGGPKIPLRFGRRDTAGPEDCVKEGNLPDAGPPSPADHLRKVFYRMGLTDQDIVALSGAHTLGRSRPERSGWGKKETKYTRAGPGTPGGSSWTPEWLKFDNSYFVEIRAKRDAELLVLPTDAVLFEDPAFAEHAERYARDQAAFFRDYARSHAKLSELGSEFDPPGGFYLDAPEVLAAAAAAK